MWAYCAERTVEGGRSGRQWRPLVVVAIGALLIGVAYVVDQIPGPVHEWSLSIGALSILIVVGGLIWLAVSLIWYFVSRSITRRRGGS